MAPGGQGGNSGQSEKFKHPPVYRKDVSSIIISPNNKTYSVYGKVVNVEIQKEYAYITVMDKKVKFRICMGEAFRVNNESAFNALKLFKIYYGKCNKQGMEVTCTCICYKQKQNDEYVGELLDIDKIRFDNKNLWQIRSILQE